MEIRRLRFFEKSLNNYLKKTISLIVFLGDFEMEQFLCYCYFASVMESVLFGLRVSESSIENSKSQAQTEGSGPAVWPGLSAFLLYMVS